MPNIVAAAIVLIIGCFIAKLVRQLLAHLFDKLNVNKLQEKAGIEVANTDRLSNTLDYIVYVLILIPMIVMALDVLKISVISDPAVHMLNLIFAFIPNIFSGLVIIVIGCRDFASHALKKLEDNMEKSNGESTEDKKED